MNTIIILLHKNHMCNDICAMIFSKIGNFILSLPAMHVGTSLFQDPWPWQMLELDPSNLYPLLHVKETCVLNGYLPLFTGDLL